MKDDESRAKLRLIVQNMSRKFQSHSYPVNRNEAKEIGLPISEEANKALEDLMWKVWLSVEEDLLENTPFHPIFELGKSAQAGKLFSPVPQLDVPMCATAGTNFQTDLEKLKASFSQMIDPVDFELTNSIIESSRLAFASKLRGKILACRNPDLMINYSVVTTSRGWEKIKEPKTGGES